MKTLRYIFFMIITLALSDIANAQELKVVSFGPELTDITARTNAVKDNNGIVCALVKISLPVEGCEFRGNKVGNPEFHVSEYWVYMAQGSKKLQINCPNREPLYFEFGSGLEAGVTYRMKLSGYPNAATSNTGENDLVLNITPKTGLSVKIDGAIQQVNNGLVMESLKYGKHHYVVKADGYVSQEDTVTISAEKKTIVNITLEPVMVTITVKSATDDATIKIDGQTKGAGGWQGQIVPGTHKIDVEKEGYMPYTETVKVTQQDNMVISIPALTPQGGELNISYKPIGSSIAIDGKMSVRPRQSFAMSLLENTT